LVKIILTKVCNLDESATTTNTEKESSVALENESVESTQTNNYTITLPSTEKETFANKEPSIETNDDTFKAKAEPDTAPETKDILVQDQNMDTTKEQNEVDVAKEDVDVFDIDDGELSDASTILLDDEELRQVYNNSSNSRPDTGNESAVQNDKELESNGAVLLNKAIVTEKMDLDDNNITAIEIEPTNGIKAFIEEEDTEKKAPVKKISLQEYLSSKQQQLQEINDSS
jgi:hypothetical protein